jgi:competence protein ComEC
VGLRSEKGTVSPVLVALSALLSTLFLPESGVHWALIIAAIGALILSLSRPSLGFPILFAAIVGGQHYEGWGQQRLATDCLGKYRNITTEIIDFPHFYDGIDGNPIARLELRVLSQSTSICQVPKKVIAYLPLALIDTPPRLGDRLVVNGRLKSVSSQLSPQVWPDQATSLGNQRFGVLSIQAVHNQTSAFRGDVQRARQMISHWIAANVKSRDEASLMQALLIGRSDALNDELWQRLKRLGVAHVVIVSGLHVGLIALFTWTALSLPRRFFQRSGDVGSVAVHCVAVIVVCWVYAVMSGWQLPVQRATLMVVALTLARWSGLSIRSMNLLIVIGLLILSVDLFSALSASFWLSFGVTATILWLLTYTETMRPVSRLLIIQSGAAVVGGVASAFFFGELSLASVITNLVAVPIITWWCLPLGLLSITAQLLTLPGASWLLSIAALPLPVFFGMLARLDAVTSSILFYSFNPHWGGLVVIAAAALAFQSGRTHQIFTLVLLAVAGLRRDSVDVLSYRLAVLDVGQGTALVLTSAASTMVFDLGGWVHPERSQTTKILIPYLASEGRSHVDYLLVSHGDDDHSAGLQDLASRLLIHRANGFSGTPCRPGQQQWLDANVEITFLSGSGRSIVEPNADSCVVILKVFDTRIMIPGDIGSEQEREIIAYWDRELLITDILIAGHHGSKTSSSATWLHRTSPNYVVYSAAAQSRFGHPHHDVTERVDSLGFESFNTAGSGTVTFTVDAEGISNIAEMRTDMSPYWIQLKR